MFSGDISGAYYSTPGSGYVRLPDDWPPGAGGFDPKEVVRCLCALPGDALSSGLFLDALGQCLEDSGYEVVIGSIRSNHKDLWMINFSDDVFGIAKDSVAVHALERAINAQFSIELAVGSPKRWVGLEFETAEDCSIK